MVFASPRLWPKEDGELIEKILLEQSINQKDYSFTDEELIKLKPQKVRLSDKKRSSRISAGRGYRRKRVNKRGGREKQLLFNQNLQKLVKD